MSKTLILTVLVAASAPMVAAAQQPAGMAPCGIPIFIAYTGAGGMATLYYGQPVILLDPPVFYGDSVFRAFTIEHECGHHVHGDILPQNASRRWFMTREQELAADCYAAGRSSRAESAAVARMFELSQGPFSPAPGYPTGNERAREIRACAR